MRDLAEINHSAYISNDKKYYSLNVRNDTRADDYVRLIERYMGGKNY